MGKASLLASLILIITASGAEVMGSPHFCPTNAALYLSNHGRHGWVRRMGFALTHGQATAPKVFDILFDDDESYVLLGRDPAELTIRTELGNMKVQWEKTGPMPDFFRIVGDDGSPGPEFTFVRCEAAPPTPTGRRMRKEFWE